MITTAPVSSDIHFAHQASHPETPNVETVVGHGSNESATVVALMARHEYRLQVQAFLANDRLRKAPLCLVKARPAHAWSAATLPDWDCLLFQCANDLMDHVISRAKKAEAFLRWAHPGEVAGFPAPIAGSSAARQSVAYRFRAGYSAQRRIGQPAPDSGRADVHAFSDVLDASTLLFDRPITSSFSLGSNVLRFLVAMHCHLRWCISSY